MAIDPGSSAEWERLLAVERRLQALIPGTVLVGGTAAALHAHHRLSMDGDHVVADLRERFEEILQSLDSTPGWTTNRIQRPVLILGALDGILTGVRQLRRTRPLETVTLAGLRVPSLPEIARIKAWLLLERDTVRDYLDTVVLLDQLGDPAAVAALRSFDEIYGRGTEHTSALAELIDRLARARPADRGTVELSGYRGVIAPWNEWAHLESRGRAWAARLAAELLKPRE